MGIASSALADLVGVLSHVGSSLVKVFVKEPEHANKTMQDIESMHAKELEKARKREAESRNREAAAKSCEEDALADSENVKNELQQMHAELEKAREREVDSQNREAAAKSREEGARADAEKAKNDLQRGIRPIVMPTREQVQAAKERIQYNDSKLHFAVCGTSGSGKSSLINAFRGLVSRDGGAAAVGVTEKTFEVTRYPDPRGQFPYSRFVWFDIPDAGTTNVPDWQYFNEQGLFVFDFVVLVYDTRFTLIDVGIIDNCIRFNKTVFIVRSKADQHMNNMIQEEGIEFPPSDDDYDRIKMEYIRSTKSNFDIHMQTMSENPEADARDRQLILSQRVYIVSANNVRTLVRNGEGHDTRKFIDEVRLIEDMLRTAARERYTTASGEEGNNLKQAILRSIGMNS